MCRKKQHVVTDDRKEMPDLICGKAAVGGNNNSMCDIGRVKGMKIKFTKKTNFLAATLLLSTFCGSTVFAGVNPSNYKNMTEYDIYAGVLADTAASDSSAEYALYDMDNDGNRELLVSQGESEADWYTIVYDNEEGLVSMLGTIYGRQSFYTAPDGNGLYAVRGKQGYQEIQRITKKSDQIKEEIIESRELGPGEEYAEYEGEVILIPLNHSLLYNVQVTAPDGGVNMRSGPGTEYDKVLPEAIPNGNVLEVYVEHMASNGNYWGYTTYNGTEGWVALTQVTKMEKAVEKTFLYNVTVSASDGGVNMRSNAGAEYELLYSMIPNGTVLDIYEERQAANGNYWGYTYYNGVEGWVALTQVERVYQPKPADNYLYKVKVLGSDGGVNMRSDAGAEYELLYSMIPNGTVLDIYEERQAANGNYWGYTYYDGVGGWIALTQVEF